MASSERQYECILFGATGYTGKYTAEHITTHLPTDFKWAVAGRSEGKLKTLVSDLKSLNPDRTQPGIETAQLDKNDLINLARKTRVLATTVGPYHKYGTIVFEACAETSTHYLDVTGETPWVYDMVHTYHETAKRTGAAMIPQCGVESAPADLICWMLASHVRESLGVGTREIVHSLHEIKGTPSGGTMDTILSVLDSYGLRELAQKSKPWVLSPVAPPQNRQSRPLLERLTGLRTVPGLGLLTTSIMGAPDVPIVQRSWGLHDGGKLYGSNFAINVYVKTTNAIAGFGVHLAATFGVLFLLLPPVRKLIARFVHQAGDGPTKEQTQGNRLEYRSIAEAETSDPNDPKRAECRFVWEGSMYHLTGVFLAEAAFVLARKSTLAHKLGGVLTPSTLGAPFVERLQQAGVKTEVKMLP